MPSPSSQYAQEVKNESSSHFYTSEISCFASLKHRVLIFVRRAFVAQRMLSEQTLEAEWKHHSSCLSCAMKAQRMSGRIFLFPLLSLTSLFSLSYVFLGNSMFSLAFCTCPPLPIKEKEGWWASKITYKHILLQISHKCIFFNLYFFLYVFVSFSIICHQKSCTFKGNWDGICEIMEFIKTPPNCSSTWAFKENMLHYCFMAVTFKGMKLSIWVDIRCLLSWISPHGKVWCKSL